MLTNSVCLLPLNALDFGIRTIIFVFISTRANLLSYTHAI